MQCEKCDTTIFNETFNAEVPGEKVQEVFERVNTTLAAETICATKTEACPRWQKLSETVIAIASEYH